MQAREITFLYIIYAYNNNSNYRLEFKLVVVILSELDSC